MNSKYTPLTNEVSTECPHHFTTVRYSTAVGSQWSLGITLTIQSDSLMKPCIIEPITRYFLPPDNTCSIRKQPLSSTYNWRWVTIVYTSTAGGWVSVTGQWCVICSLNPGEYNITVVRSVRCFLKWQKNSSSYTREDVSTLYTHYLHCKPAQMGAAPDHTPTALFPLAVQVLASSPPILSSSGGHETTYCARVPYEEDGVSWW